MNARKAIFEVFPAKDGFRWHVKRGGRIIADSGEAYGRRRGATRSVENLTNAIAQGAFRVDVLQQSPKGRRKRK